MLRSCLDPARAGGSPDDAHALWRRRLLHDSRVGEVRREVLLRRRVDGAPLDRDTYRRIVAAALARLDPVATAAALGWPLGKLLDVERQIGLRITVTGPHFEDHP
ncbi:hypothetical protein [Rhodoplanes roseus]|uniref:hypothetical protein n=1 Tax=Rhodoplanes roseus TaxID=29409 RepID=UPI000DAD799B|nr:hypothetical protein [Rhodoplanes roseus]